MEANAVPMANTLIDTWTARFIDGVLFRPLSPIIIIQIQALTFLIDCYKDQNQKDK